MRTFLIAAAIALVAVPCYAQGMGGGKKHAKQDQATQDQKKKPDDKGYKASLSGLPDQAYDPWRGVR
jgi:uncharacterized protein YdeI (BOF family)